MTDIRPELIKRESDMHHFECLLWCRHEHAADGGPELPGRGSSLMVVEVSFIFPSHFIGEQWACVVVCGIWRRPEYKQHELNTCLAAILPLSVGTEAKWIFPPLHHRYSQSTGFFVAVNYLRELEFFKSVGLSVLLWKHRATLGPPWRRTWVTYILNPSKQKKKKGGD